MKKLIKIVSVTLLQLLFLVIYSNTFAQSIEIHALSFKNVSATKNYFHYNGDGFIIISGHRGGATKGFPENCIPTFEHTLSVTPAMFETDPGLTKDGNAVMLHDATLDRTTTGHGKLVNYTLSQVEKFHLKDPEGDITQYHLNTLQQMIKWAKGKTIINLDIKDVPPIMKVKLVKKYDAFNYVMFTVHNAKEAKFFYNYDHRSLFSAWVLSRKALNKYAASGIPWSNFLIAYVGSKITPKSRMLCKLLHKKGVMVMIGAAPSYDKLSTKTERANAYRKIIRTGFDIIESNRPIEVANEVKKLYPKKSEKYKYWKTRRVKSRYEYSHIQK